MRIDKANLGHGLRAALGLIYPEVCQLCKAERAEVREGLVCRPCWSQVRFIRPPFCDRCGLPFDGEIPSRFVCANCLDLEFAFSSARSAVVAKTVVLEVIHRFKYQRALWFEPFLADLLVREAAPALAGGAWDYLVPVPLHPLKLREREFNQATLLARPLSQATGIPLAETLVERIQPTATQTRLTREKRADNMRNAFAVRPGAGLAGKRIVVVDDVFTTGATTNACAKALRRAGVAEVAVWTVARGL